MTAARVIHFGQDECFRTPIMRAAGYAVQLCTCIRELQAALKSADAADLICISESYSQPREDALMIARSMSTAPVVLFRSTMHRYIADRFDLEIDTLVTPEIWLVQLNRLILQFQVMRGRSREVPSAAREQESQLHARIVDEPRKASPE